MFSVSGQSFTAQFFFCTILMYPIILGKWVAVLEQSSQTIQLVPVPMTLSSDLPACLQSWSAAFDATRGKILPKHTQFDFDFKVTVDLIHISSPICPLTLKEEACLEEWTWDMLAKYYIFKKASSVTVSSIMPGIVRPSKKARKAGKPVSKLTKLTDLNQTVD
ncbi:hypothetical protein DSO57_1013652 [Entomophthora muscae]|uniref:Uncharacterized protein n=1 Tax=Entomophthora muscae TaxID=34485 RepID=A0ACC2T5P1_9FUNG|nr:hypothetical protein DSO57_1013652 [Entomophthora muscae]